MSKKLDGLIQLLQQENFWGAQPMFGGWIELKRVPGLGSQYSLLATPWFNDPDRISINVTKGNEHDVWEVLDGCGLDVEIAAEDSTLAEIFYSYKVAMQSALPELLHQIRMVEKAAPHPIPPAAPRPHLIKPFIGFTVDHVREWLRERLLELGMGFHPDTPGAGYVTADDKPFYTREQAAIYDASMSACWAAVEHTEFDLYNLGLAAAAELGLIPKPEEVYRGAAAPVDTMNPSAGPRKERFYARQHFVSIEGVQCFVIDVYDQESHQLAKITAGMAQRKAKLQGYQAALKIAEMLNKGEGGDLVWHSSWES